MESSKYNIIWKNSSEPNIITKEDSEYATFLKKLERTCNNDGYLDSLFYTHKSKSDGKTDIDDSKIKPFHPYDIAKQRKQFIADFDENMKKINMGLLQEKRNERLLKRKEGDIIKKKHVLNQSLHDFEADVNQKKFAEDKKLSENAENFENIRKSFYLEKSKNIKDRMIQSVRMSVDHKGKSRRSNQNVSVLIRKFNAKKNELETSSKGITKTMHEYESKLAFQESRHKELQKELESISEALNMERMKVKSLEAGTQSERLEKQEENWMKDKNWEAALDTFVNKSDSGYKTAEMKCKILDGHLDKKTEEHGIKLCEYNGSLNTIRNKLNNCENNQRKLIEEANHFNLVLRKMELDEKVHSAVSKRTDLIDEKVEELTSDRLDRENRYSERLTNTLFEMELANQSDNAFHLKNNLHRIKDSEQKLYKLMNNESKNIKQHSISLSRLENTLNDVQNSNSSRLNNELRLANRREQALAEEVARERTKLMEMQAKRNMYFNELLACRKQLKSDQYLLQKSEKNEHRLNQIKEKSENRTTFLPAVVA